MLGALVLLLLFLLINRDSLTILESLGEESRRRFTGGDPFLDVVVMIMLAGAIASALIMAFWPRSETPRQYRVLHRYFGPAYEGLHRAPAGRPLRHRMLQFCLAAMERARRLRVYGRFAG